MRTIDDIRADRLAELPDLEVKLTNAKGVQSSGTMSWRRSGVSGPPIDVERSLVGHYERLIGEQQRLLAHLDEMR